MNAALMPELAANAAEAMVRVLDRRRLEKLPAFDVEEVVPVCLAFRDSLRGAQDRLRKRLIEGSDSLSFAEQCLPVQDAVESCLSFIRRLSALVDDARLQEAEAELAGFRTLLLQWRAAATRPLPSVDAATLDRVRQSFERGEAERADDILKRLREGDEALAER